jgi:hypothetical protein
MNYSNQVAPRCMEFRSAVKRYLAPGPDPMSDAVDQRVCW